MVQTICRVFRVLLAISFIPTGIVKILGQRFAEGLPHNNPLGHYFDALLQTSYYYNFIGWAQLTIAILLLVPRTALLGAIGYFTMSINITVLTYATRFDGTRMNTLGLLASTFLLVWDYGRLKFILFKPFENKHLVITKPLGKRLRWWFFGGVIAITAIVIGGTFYLFDIVPENEEAECRNQCSGKNAHACPVFCDCIYQKGQPLDSALATYKQLKVKR